MLNVGLWVFFLCFHGLSFQLSVSSAGSSGGFNAAASPGSSARAKLGKVDG